MENSLVLIVEDEPDIAHILSAYLEREGYRTVRAGDGETALQHHAFLSPDIVLLDARLPKLDGFSVLGPVAAYPQHAGDHDNGAG